MGSGRADTSPTEQYVLFRKKFATPDKGFCEYDFYTREHRWDKSIDKANRWKTLKGALAAKARCVSLYSRVMIGMSDIYIGKFAIVLTEVPMEEEEHDAFHSLDPTQQEMLIKWERRVKSQ